MNPTAHRAGREARISPAPNRGRFLSEEAALGEVVRRIVDAFHPQEVRLFGSRLAGNASPDSDFDLVVVLDEDASESWLDADVIYRPLVGSGVGCDVIACRRNEFDAVLRDRANPWGAALGEGEGAPCPRLIASRRSS